MGITYTCAICGGTYQQADPPARCLVNHPPGICCHYGEREIVPGNRKAHVPEQNERMVISTFDLIVIAGTLMDSLGEPPVFHFREETRVAVYERLEKQLQSTYFVVDPVKVVLSAEDYHGR